MVKPLSQLPADLRRRVDKIGDAIDRSVRDTVRAAAIAAKDAQLQAMREDAGGDLRLSRVRSGKGAKIGARYDLAGQGRHSTATVRAIGPVPLIANPIKAHTIPRARGRRSRKRLSIPGIGVRMSVDHPGVRRGKDTWNRGARKAAPRVTKIMGTRTDAAVRRAFLNG